MLQHTIGEGRIIGLRFERQISGVADHALEWYSEAIAQALGRQDCAEALIDPHNAVTFFYCCSRPATPAAADVEQEVALGRGKRQDRDGVLSERSDEVSVEDAIGGPDEIGDDWVHVTTLLGDFLTDLTALIMRQPERFREEGVLA